MIIGNVALGSTCLISIGKSTVSYVIGANVIIYSLHKITFTVNASEFTQLESLTQPLISK